MGQSANFLYSGQGNLFKNGASIGAAGVTGTGTNGDIFAISLTSSTSAFSTQSGTLAFG